MLESLVLRNCLRCIPQPVSILFRLWVGWQIPSISPVSRLKRETVNCVTNACLDKEQGVEVSSFVYAVLLGYSRSKGHIERRKASDLKIGFFTVIKKLRNLRFKRVLFKMPFSRRSFRSFNKRLSKSPMPKKRNYLISQVVFQVRGCKRSEQSNELIKDVCANIFGEAISFTCIRLRRIFQ